MIQEDGKFKYHMKSDRLFRSLIIFLGGVFLSFFTTIQVYAGINLTFLGAAEEVSGSCILFETGDTKFLVDCGLFFPKDEGLDIKARRQNAIYRNESIYFDPAKLDFLLLTHAHSDHCGRLPLIVRRGFRGKIYCTKSTEELLKIQLSSTLEHHGGFGEEIFIKSKKSHVLHPGSECPWVKKIKPENKEIIKLRREDISLFDKRLSVCNVCIRKEVKSDLERIVIIDYRKKYRLSPDVEVRAQDAGHILGSAMYEIWIKTGSKEVRFVCTGDIGNRYSPMLKEPAAISEADYIIMESAYGNRSRRISGNPFNSFLKQLEMGIRENHTIIIPARALGRTQEVLYVLQNAKSDGIIPSDVKVYLSSRTAERCNQIYMNFFSHDVESYFDQKIWSLKENHKPLFCSYDYIKELPRSPPSPCIFVATSGDASYAKAKELVKLYISNGNARISFVGYLPEGSLGKKIIQKVLGERIEIDKKEYIIRARVEKFDEFSSHADKDQLLRWLSNLKTPKEIFLVHGTPESTKGLATSIHNTYGWSARPASFRERIVIQD